MTKNNIMKEAKYITVRKTRYTRLYQDTLSGTPAQICAWKMRLRYAILKAWIK